MAKTRLKQSSRGALARFAIDQIKKTQSTEAADLAYSACARMVNLLVTGKYPPKDMKILARYDVAEEDRCIYLSEGGAHYARFLFEKEDRRIPVRPSGSYNSRTPYLLDDEQAEKLRIYKKAAKDREDAIEARMSDFNALIFASKTFEDVVEVWPACASLRAIICGHSTSLSVMSSDVVARLKADPAFSKKEA